MGNHNSAQVQKIFAKVNSDNSGVITLDQFIQNQNLPDVEHWSNTHSPLLLFRFDQSQEGSINKEEFNRLLKYLQIADKKAQHLKAAKNKKGLQSPKTGMKRSASQVWTCVSQATASSLNLSRDEPPPMITGTHKDEVEQCALELEESELKELIQKEAKQFFTVLLKTKQGRTQFLNWLFLLADVHKNGFISVDELSLVLSALSYDGIVPEYLAFDPINPKASAESIMEDYDTSHTGALTKEEFMVFGDLILKCYEYGGNSDEGEEHHIIQKYQLKRIIGKGSSGVVWLGVDVETKHKKAIKVIPIGDVSDMSRVDVEIKAMLMLKHPNIVALEEVLETEENVYFVMELCGGGSLAERVSEEPFSEDSARYWFLQIVDAVQYCHDKGVAHRDLKLENLLLDNEGHLKVTDFGHAGIFARGWDVFSTGMMGTLLHISPEQLEGKCYHGEKIDIWALGVLLYRMVTGEAPFFSHDPEEFVNSIKTASYKVPPSLSPELDNFLQKLLRVCPEKRLSCAQILQEPWCKGTKLLPTLMTEKIYLDKCEDVSKCWDAIKKVTTKHMHMNENPPPPGEPYALRMAKCYYPKKEVKFAILFKVEDSQQYFQFNLKQGEGFDFHKMVSKIKAKLTHTSKLKLKTTHMKFSEAEDLTEDSEDSGHNGLSPLRSSNNWRNSSSGWRNSSSGLRSSSGLSSSGYHTFDPAENVEPPPSLSQDQAAKGTEKD